MNVFARSCRRIGLPCVRAGLAFLLLAWSSPGLSGQPFEAAEALFRQDPRWLGTDGAASTPLGDGRIFWSFEDTFIADSTRHRRAESDMVRNSIAIQHGDDPLTARMEFHWGTDDQGRPTSFFPDDGDAWYWTGGALRLDDGPLVVFLARTIDTPGEGLGFRNDGYALAVIDNPEAPVPEWSLRVVPGDELPFDALPATTLVRQGAHVVGLALRQVGTHAGSLVRYRTEDLAGGRLERAEWWAGDAVGWVPTSAVAETGPLIVIDDAGSESTIHWDETLDAYLHVTTYGFGGATIGVRTAPHLTGPWSAPRTVYHPPELNRPRPFIYSALAHPELMAPEPGQLIVTYATNSFDFGDLFTEEGEQALYWPRVITITP